jgi:hypothetical protein
MASRKQRIRAAVQQLGERGQGKRFPERLRQRAAAYARDRVADGVTVAAIAEEIGVSGTSLGRWLLKYDAEPAPAFEEVELVDPEPLETSLLVHGPAGIVIEGLDVSSLAELLRRLE